MLINDKTLRPVGLAYEIYLKAKSNLWSTSCVLAVANWKLMIEKLNIQNRKFYRRSQQPSAFKNFEAEIIVSYRFNRLLLVTNTQSMLRLRRPNKWLTVENSRRRKYSWKIQGCQSTSVICLSTFSGSYGLIGLAILSNQWRIADDSICIFNRCQTFSQISANFFWKLVENHVLYHFSWVQRG